jgi:hypothetical protein
MKTLFLAFRILGGSFAVGIGLWFGLYAGASIVGIPEIHPVINLTGEEAEILRDGVIDILQNVCAG